jgi:hypothetical protein
MLYIPNEVKIVKERVNFTLILFVFGDSERNLLDFCSKI